MIVEGVVSGWPPPALPHRTTIATNNEKEAAC